MDNTRGIILMVLAMAGFAVEDMFVKILSDDLEVGQILFLLALFGTPIFVVIAWRKGEWIFDRALLSTAFVTRNLAEMVGGLGFVTALALIPLATASTILQAMPLMMTVGAAVFLGEKVGWRRWSAVVVGFVGVLLVVKPGVEGFEPAALWALLAVLALTVRDLVTRRLPATLSSTVVSAWGFAAVGVLGLAMMIASGDIDPVSVRHVLFVMACVAIGTGAYWAMTEASRAGEVATIIPFRYSRLVFALVIGAVVFSEFPDVLTMIGATLIIASGLYSFARERRLNAMRRKAAAMVIP